jgi:hypothetical protein
MIGAWTRLEEPEYSAAWDAFYERFEFTPTGGRALPAIPDPRPSVTFDIQGISEAVAANVEAAARRAFLVVFGADIEVLVLDWQHDAFRVRPGQEAPVAVGADGLPLVPTVLPDGDYYVHATADLDNGTFGHPWEPSLCVFGPKFTPTLGSELRALLPVLRESGLS